LQQNLPIGGTPPAEVFPANGNGALSFSLHETFALPIY
jgi:hypothetical protein